MPQPKHTEKTCTDSLRLLGDYWTLSIIDALRDQELRFCELQRVLGMVNPVTLTNRLQTLEVKNLLHRCVGAVDEVSVSYRLTSLGQEALQVLDAVHTFSKKLDIKK